MILRGSEEAECGSNESRGKNLSSRSSPIRVPIVDDHAVVREGLARRRLGEQAVLDWLAATRRGG